MEENHVRLVRRDILVKKTEEIEKKLLDWDKGDKEIQDKGKKEEHE